MSAADRERRARGVRSRAATRAWEYRQRHHAGGTWHRLRLLLAEARECWLIPEQEAERLLREGFVPDPVGHELEPPKEIFVLPADRIVRLTERREVRVGLSAELLAARYLALVPFPPAPSTGAVVQVPDQRHVR